MLIDILDDVLLLLLIAASLFFALGKFVRHRSPQWIGSLERHRIRVLFGLISLLFAIKISEEVIGGEAGPIDEALMLMLRDTVPLSWATPFKWITDTGSSWVLVPLTIVISIWLLLVKRWFEAAIMAGSMLIGSLFIYFVKHAVGRDRPALWETDWYWGSSFPSGHTLATTVFATAVVLVCRRIWPSSRMFTVPLAGLWIALMALSRLVLGVHWPTDVLAAAAIGSFLPLLLAALIRIVQFRRRAAARHPAG